MRKPMPANPWQLKVLDLEKRLRDANEREAELRGRIHELELLLAARSGVTADTQGEAPQTDNAKRANREAAPGHRRKPQVLWIVDGRFVCEPGVGGMQLGELPDYDVRGYELVHVSQSEYDQLMEEYRAEHGQYPDT